MYTLIYLIYTWYTNIKLLFREIKTMGFTKWAKVGDRIPSKTYPCQVILALKGLKLPLCLFMFLRRRGKCTFWIFKRNKNTPCLWRFWCLMIKNHILFFNFLIEYLNCMGQSRVHVKWSTRQTRFVKKSTFIIFC